MEWSQLSIEILEVDFGSFVVGNSNWDKISEGIIKKMFTFETE